jgi:hypothetical protein
MSNPALWNLLRAERLPDGPRDRGVANDPNLESAHPADKLLACGILPRILGVRCSVFSSTFSGLPDEH